MFLKGSLGGLCARAQHGFSVDGAHGLMAMAMAHVHVHAHSEVGRSSRVEEGDAIALHCIALECIVLNWIEIKTDCKRNNHH